MLRLEPALHERLRRLAARKECSLNQLCAELLRNSLAAGAAETGSLEIASEVLPAVVIDQTARRLGKRLEGLVLFGSAARGQMWESSDVDLLVVLRQGVSLTRELYAMWDAEIAPLASSLSHRISPHFTVLPSGVRNAGGLWFEAALDGVILWDPYLHVAGLLSRLRQEIAAGGVVRRLAHGQPYWVRAAGTA